MIPKKIYLSKKGLQDVITCDRMVSIDEPYDELTEEYVNLKQVWHDASEEPKKPYAILCAGMNDDYWLIDSEEVKKNFVEWTYFVRCTELIIWAHISDLLPKVKSIIYREDWRE